MEPIESIVRAARNGRPDAHSALLVRASAFARVAARALVDDAFAIDDVVQEALLEMESTLHRLRKPEAFEAWLRWIVRKQADRWRRSRREALVPEIPEIGAEDPAFKRVVDVDDARRVLLHTSDKDRLLLILRYTHDWSDEQLAELLEISAGAVRKRLWDARRRLQRSLTDRKEPPMTLDTLFGTVVRPDADVDLGEPAQLRRPQSFAPIATGLAAIDLLAPLPRGGIVDLRAIMPLVLLSEMIGNMATQGPAAIVGVEARRKDQTGWYSRLHRFTRPARTASLSIVVESVDALDADALAFGGRIAASLAADGTDVLLVVDRVTSAAVGIDALRAHAGIGDAGSVTALGWWLDGDDVDARLVTAEQASGGLTPPVDPDASFSKALDGRLRELSVKVRSALHRSTELRAVLSQPFDPDRDGWSGHSTEYISLPSVIASVEAILKR